MSGAPGCWCTNPNQTERALVVVKQGKPEVPLVDTEVPKPEEVPMTQEDLEQERLQRQLELDVLWEAHEADLGRLRAEEERRRAGEAAAAEEARRGEEAAAAAARAEQEALMAEERRLRQQKIAAFLKASGYGDDLSTPKKTMRGKQKWPIHTAAKRGDADMVKMLIDERADPNIKDSKGSTPLHIAAKHLPRSSPESHEKVIVLLTGKESG